MRKLILALVASGILLSGCSKSESSPEGEKTKLQQLDELDVQLQQLNIQVLRIDDDVVLPSDLTEEELLLVEVQLEKVVRLGNEVLEVGAEERLSLQSKNQILLMIENAEIYLDQVQDRLKWVDAGAGAVKLHKEAKELEEALRLNTFRLYHYQVSYEVDDPTFQFERKLRQLSLNEKEDLRVLLIRQDGLLGNQIAVLKKIQRRYGKRFLRDFKAIAGYEQDQRLTWDYLDLVEKRSRSRRRH